VSAPEGQFSPASLAAVVGDKPETFRSPLAPVIWWVWLVFALANLIDLAFQGHDHFAAVVAAILVLVTGVAYVTAFRPRVLAGPADLRIQNPLRDHRVSWASVTGVDLGDSLQVHCQWEEAGQTRTKTLYGWAVHSSRRGRYKADLRSRSRPVTRSQQQTGYAQLPPQARELLGKTDAEHIVALLEQRIAAARAGDAPATRPISGWHWLSVGALVVPAVLVTIVSLV
jgi:hypothetical protein